MRDQLLGIKLDNLGKRGPRVSVWVLSMAIILVVMIVAFAERRLDEYEHSRLRAEILLLSIEEDAAELAIAEYQAIREGEVTPQIAEDAAENSREIEQTLDELEQLDPRSEEPARISEELGRYRALVDEELALIEAGRLEQAETLDEQRVDPAFEVLHEVLEEAGARYEAQAQSADVFVVAATYAMALLAAVTLVVVARLWQREQARRSEQEALRRSEERFRALAQNVSDALTVVGAEGTMLYESPSVERLFGYKPEDRLGKSAFELVHPDDLGRVREVFAGVLDNPGITPPVEARVRHADGSWRHVEAIGNNLLDDPNVRGIVVNTRDITERKHSEEALRQSEERHRAVVEQAVEGIYLVDLDSKRILESNPAFRRLLGRSAEELSEMTLYDIVAHDPSSVDAKVRRVVEEGFLGIGARQHRRKDGSLVDVEVSASLIPYQGRDALSCVAHDITERKRTEDMLREAEAKYRTLAEQIPAVVYRQELEDNDTISYVSPRVEEMLGYSAHEYVQEPGFWVSTTHPDDRERVLAEDARTEETGEPFRMEYRKIMRDGRVIWVHDEAALVREESGRPLYWQGVMHDVTERKRAEEARREAEEKYRTLVEQLPAVTYVEALDQGKRETEISYVSPQVEKILGYSVEEWSSSPDLWEDLLHPDDRKRVLDEDARTEAAGEPFFAEYRILARDGRVVWVQDQAALVRDEEGRARYWQGFMLDITGRKEAEENLRRSEERFRSLVQHSSDVITVLGADGTIRYESPSVERVLGYGPEEGVGTNVLDRVHPDDIEWVRDKLAGVTVRTQARSTTWYRVRDKQGSWRHFETLVTNLLDNPSVGGIVLNSRDITKRKRAEEALRESHAILHGVTEGSTDVIFVKDRQGRYLMVNSTLAGLFGRTVEEMVGAHHGELFVPDEARRIREDDRRIMATGETETYEESFRIGGRERTYLTTRGVHRDHRGEVAGTFGVARDITERKEAEAALRESEERYRNLVENIPAVVYIDRADAPDVAAYTSPQIEALVGYTSEEWLGGRLWKKLIHPDDRGWVLEIDGRARAAEERFCEEYRLIARDGSVVWVRDESELLRDEAGRPLLWQGVLLNVTERKNAEEELQRSLQRLSALNEASRLLNSTLELGEIGRRLLETAHRVAAPAASAVYLQDKQGEVRIGYTLGPEELLGRAASTPAATAARRAALEGRQRRPFRLRPPGSDGPPLAGLCVPLRVRERTIGVLQAYGSESLAEEATVDTLTGLANQAAGALENARLYAELGDRENQLKELVGRLIMAQEEERRRVAREVHDGLTQMLVAAHQHLQTFADYHPPDDPEGREELGWVLGVVQQTVGEARRVIADLRPAPLDDFGLATAIRLQAEALRDEGWDVNYEETLGEERLPVAMETALFRVAQEALTNVRKHAGTTRVGIALERLENGVRVRVWDHGCGFSPGANGGGPGERVGLSSMRERVALFGGTLEVDSRPGEGTSVVAEIPLVREAISLEGA